MRHSKSHVLSLVVMAGLVSGVRPADAQSVASPFVDHHERAKSRLIAARHGGKLYAFVEIAMPEGWKTYWRNPGDAGGLPPTFDFAKSDNVAAARVRYPAPKRLTDRAGDTIGYKGRALFPVEIDVTMQEQPVHLKLSANFGVCRDICVPVDASHELTVTPGALGEADASLTAAIAGVPKAAQASPPRIAAKAVPGATPHVLFEAKFPAGGGEDADLFVEAPDGLYVPMVKRRSTGADGSVQFISTLASEAELKQLIGQRLKVTLVDKSGAVETDVTLAP